MDRPTSLSSTLRQLGVLCALATLAALPARAQGARLPRGAESNRHLIAGAPFGALYGVVGTEYQRVDLGGLSLGLGGSLVRFDDDRFRTVEGTLRYYPAGRGFGGFSVGLTAGYAHIRDEAESAVVPELDLPRRTVSGPTVGVSADYNWLVGPYRRLVVGVGVGAKRVFTDDRAPDTDVLDYDDLRTYPTVRFVVGFTR